MSRIFPDSLLPTPYSHSEAVDSIHGPAFFDLGDPTEHLGVGLLDTAHVAPEAVLVELLAGLLIPEAAGVGADLVGQHQVPALAPADLYLEVHEHDALLVEVGP